ncbi:hypothetical protein [Pseudomonas mohnii]
MAVGRKNHTQSLSSFEAQQAFERLVRDLRIPKSGILEMLLVAIPTEDLVGLMSGKLSLQQARVVGLDATSALAIRHEIENSLSLLGPRLVEAARLATAQGVAAALQGEG